MATATVTHTRMPEYEKAGKHARQYLVRAAVESMLYVAYGKVLKRDLVEKFGLPEDQAATMLKAIAVDLEGDIRKI